MQLCGKTVFKYIFITISSIFFSFGSIYSICTRPPISFTEPQVIDLKSVQGNQSKLHSYLSGAEYLLVGFSSASCPHCAEMAGWMNTNNEFQNKVSGDGSCEFVTLVHDEPDPSKAITKRLNNPLVSGNTSFVGSRSRTVVDLENTRYTTPTVYGGPEITGTPTFMIINRQGQMMAMKKGGLPSLFDTLCIANSCNGQGNPPPGNIDPPGTGSCSGGGGGGATDGGTSDGGATDGGATDGGATDGGTSDGGATDGGTSDGGTNGGGTNGGGASAGGTSAGGANAGGANAGGTSAGGTSAGGASAGGASAGGANAGGVIGEMRPGRLQLEIPVTNGIQTDIVANQKELNSQNSKESLKGFFRIFNERMWILLMLVLFIAVIYAGYTLITSIGDSEKMKTGLRMLLYVVFGLVIAILSWAVISLIAGMFA